ncbi:MAG: carbohydrate porin [Candidatus Omnitrophica bacterium]|nr:carbohydrate porin [Candidatus Omnitrophota bacterium]MDD5042457.1 carbohydrate porin [Candidatus Omnitrophota bacterium]MDD5501142.1 carbohydrate porin [Candidatus Omnitrophota bacterium]
MFLRSILSCSLVLGVLATGVPAFADEGATSAELKKMRIRLEALEQKVAEQDSYIAKQRTESAGQKEKIAQYESQLSRFEENLHRMPGQPIQLLEGLELGVGGTVILQGADNSNYRDGDTEKSSRADASYSADVTLSKEFEEVGGRAFLHLEAGQGSGLEDNLIVYSNVNRDAGDSEAKAELTEFWYEQDLFKDKAVVTFGKLDSSAYFDQNEAANDETSQFLGRIFRNSPVIEFPDNGAGVRFAWLPVDWLELGYGVFDGTGSWEDIGDSLFNIGQVHFKTNLFGLSGNYRFYAWNNNADHIKWLDSGKTKESSYGLGLSFDQKLNDAVTLFARYGWQNPEAYNPEITAADGSNYSLEQSWSAGFQVEGASWGREKDVFGFAVGQIMPSDDYKKANNLSAKTEGHLEAYYNIHINDHLSVSPDVQYIWNPYGKDVASNTGGIFVGGLRAQVDF